MSKKSVVAFFLLLISSGAAAQSLQGAADREKARRKRLPRTVKVYTDDDLAQMKKDEPESTDAPPAEPVAESTPVPDFERERAKAEALARAQQKDDEWAVARNQYQSRYDAVKADIGQIRRVQAACEKNLPYMMAYPAMDDCKAYPPQIKAKETELRLIEDEAADDARRRGVFPSKARLR